MEQDTVTVKKVLNAYQIAGLALATSTFVAVAVLVVLRRTILSRPTTDDSAGTGAAQPAVDTEIPSQTPRHFSEDLIIPGFTETGSDILKDQDEGRPSAGNV